MMSKPISCMHWLHQFVETCFAQEKKECCFAGRLASDNSDIMDCTLRRRAINFSRPALQSSRVVLKRLLMKIEHVTLNGKDEHAVVRDLVELSQSHGGRTTAPGQVWRDHCPLFTKHANCKEWMTVSGSAYCGGAGVVASRLRGLKVTLTGHSQRTQRCPKADPYCRHSRAHVVLLPTF